MIPTCNSSTPSNFVHPTRISSATDNTHTRSRGSSSRGPPRRHQCRFQFSLCTAAALGLVLLAGHASQQDCQGSSYGSGVNALPVIRSSLVATASVPAAAVVGDTSPQAVQKPYQQPHQQQQQQQQILALHTSNSVAFSAASATVSGLDGRIRLALPKHASFATAGATTGLFADSGRILASELISETQLPSLQDIATTITNVPKQDEQHLAFLDLMTRVSGKSRDQAEAEIREERRVIQAAVRKELEMQLQLQRQEQDNVAEGDASIELKQVRKLHAAPASEVKSKVGEKNYHHKGEEAKEKGKGKHGKKGKQEKTKGPVKAASSGGNGGVGGGIKTTPTIFYVPHQDDDALAMALAIREHIEAGRKVIVHLYSDGINALLRDIVAGAAPCTLQHPPHKMDLTLQDVVTGRTHEFRQSLRALGVRDEDIFETGWSDIEPLKDYGEFQKKLRELILGYERKYPGASHKCISGEYDRDSVGRNPTHRACWDVATQLLQEFPQGWPASRQLWDLSAQFIRALPQFLPYKQKALDQYKRWDPSKGELAWGYHSVKALIDAAYNDPHVYLDMLDNDPTNPENLRRNKMGGGGVKGKGNFEVGGGEGVEEEEEEHGVFPAVWRSSWEKDANKMLLEEDAKQQQQQQQAQEQEQEMDTDDMLMGLHRKVLGAHWLGASSSSATTVPHFETSKKGVAEWDEKEADMRLQVLKAFDDAAQRPEGKEYHDSIRAMARSGI